MTELPMSKFQLTIVSSSSEPEAARKELQFAINQHTKSPGAVIDRIDDLERIWGEVVTKLTSLAAKTQVVAAESDFELSEVEFHVGIEAGLSVGLVTKGDASVSITFARKKAQS